MLSGGHQIGVPGRLRLQPSDHKSRAARLATRCRGEKVARSGGTPGSQWRGILDETKNAAANFFRERVLSFAFFIRKLSIPGCDVRV